VAISDEINFNDRSRATFYQRTGMRKQKLFPKIISAILICKWQANYPSHFPGFPKYGDQVLSAPQKNPHFSFAFC